MSTGLSDRIGNFFIEACFAELDALKPGNVHRYSEGHGMSVADFERSAIAAAPALAAPGASVGRRIVTAVEKTRVAAGCNTNLGIILLAAPLVHGALLDAGATCLVDRVARTLAELTVNDAELAYDAIRLADPAGMGESKRHDIRHTPTVNLRRTMEAAADHDLIARQYANGFAEVMGFGCSRAVEADALWGPGRWTAVAVFLGFLGRFADTHVARKFGDASAERLRERARPYDSQLMESQNPENLEADLLAFDGSLKDDGINPGTCADLTVASLLARRLGNMINKGYY